ncbi:hypothetical protein QJS66_08235 [Kocuria rhizophila]|nr:hypothetical protein QJS66_08235 [Kocuria rhizophila]
MDELDVVSSHRTWSRSPPFRTGGSWRSRSPPCAPGARAESTYRPEPDSAVHATVGPGRRRRRAAAAGWPVPRWPSRAPLPCRTVPWTSRTRCGAMPDVYTGFEAPDPSAEALDPQCCTVTSWRGPSRPPRPEWPTPGTRLPLADGWATRAALRCSARWCWGFRADHGPPGGRDR